MNRDLIDRVVAAILYEGYVLYPYRPSIKTRQRWTFGGLVPREYSEANEEADPWRIRTECLLRGGHSTRLTVRVRFLHVVERIVSECDARHSGSSESVKPELRNAKSIRSESKTLHSWEEASEREVLLSGLCLEEISTQGASRDFEFGAWRQTDPILDASKRVIGFRERRRRTVSGVIRVSAAPAGEGLFRICVDVENRSGMDADAASREDAMKCGMASTHTLLECDGGEFLSLIDPPDEAADASAACRNVGGWPVLVGEPGDRDAMLSAPIILYDYPQIAPESPGDLFDGTEIDEILSLRILTLTDAEKRDMARIDDRTAAILERTEMLSSDGLLSLHGAIRERKPSKAGE